MSSLSKGSTSSCVTDEDIGELRRGPWTLEEDTLLTHYISSHGEGRWNLLSKRSGLRRTGKSCRLRWLNYLKPDVKRGNLTPQEQLLILQLHSKWGNRWSKIAQHLPGRTDNEIKNYWRTRVQKQARHMKIDCNSAAFQEVIRCLWMPRLLQKIQGMSSSPAPDSVILPQYSATSTTAQPPINHSSPFPAQQQVISPNGKNSISEQCTRSPSMITSSASMNIPQILEYQTSFPFQAMGTSSDYDSVFLKGCYSNVENISYDDMEMFSSLAASVVAPAGQFEDSNIGGNCHLSGNNWIGNNLADGLWNMDESWQFSSS